MEKGTKKINFKVVALVMVIAIVFVSLAAVFSKNAYRFGIGLSKEDRLALEYNEFTENDYATQSENVRFLAFFERDLNNDGYSEKYDGTIKDMSSLDTLYLDINVLSDGTFKNGKVTFSNDSNFNYKMAMQKDAVLSKNYVSDNVKEIIFNDVTAGTRELINGTIKPNTRVDNYYSKVTQVRLTGIFVPSDPELEEIQIDKTIDLTVDWYGNTQTKLNTKSHSEDKEWFEETETVSDPNVSISFNSEELLEQLLIKNATVVVTMPQLKGYYPEDIEATGVERISASQIKISRDAIVDGEDNITTAVSRKNNYYIKMKYPEVAYKEMYEEWIAGGSSMETLIFNIKASYTGLNNPKFDDAISYDTNTATVTVKIGADDDGVLYPETYFLTEIPGVELETKGKTLERDYKGRWGWVKVYGLDKDLLLDAYEGKNDGKFNYEVGYRALYWDNGVRLSDMRIEMEPMQSDKIGDIDIGTYGEVYGFYSPMLPYLLQNGAEIYIYDATGYELTEEQNDFSIDERISFSGNRLIKSFTPADTDIIERYLYTSKENPYVIKSDENTIISNSGRITDLIIDIKHAPFKGDFVFYAIKDLKCYPDGYTTANPSGLTPVIDRDLITAANNVRSYAKANYEWVGDDPRLQQPEGEYEQRGSSQDNDIIDLIDKSSVANISMLNNNFEPGEENTNKIIYINADKRYYEDATWKDGIFVVEVPESIINMEINSITASEGTTIKGWSFDKENGKYYLKIITSNDEEQNHIQLIIDAEMVVDPRPGMGVGGELKLYYENKEHKYYYTGKRASDELDINDNEDIYEIVGFAKTAFSVASPSSIVTFQTVSNYDENGSITVAPNIADISKQTRSAEMNLYVINGYSALVSGTKILGRVPYENNKYVLSDSYIGSTFSATMNEGGITLPASISENTKVYYSEVAEPTADVTLEENGWKLGEYVTDWTKIKSFLIDCSQYSLRSGENYVFTYSLTVPEGLEYNDSSYGTHAVFYNYHAENGILPMETEPTKVGIKVARNFNFEGIKFKEGTIRTVADATYKLSQFNVLNEVEQEKSMVSNGSGVFNAKHLYVNAEYTLTETDSPANYLRNNNVIRFKVVENEDLSLSVVTLSESGFRDTPTFTDVNGVDTLQVEVEDAPKYQLNITYMDTAVNEVIPNAVFNLGEETYMTDDEGKASVTRLSPNMQYSITETKVDGCAEVNHGFNLTKTDGVYSFVKDEEMRLDSIVNDDTEDLIQVNVTILKQSAPRFSLEIVKVEKDNTIEDLAEMIKLPGAVFSLSSRDNSIYLDEIESDENAVTSVERLYQFSLESGTAGEYTLVEERAPNGYILNQEEISFVVKTINDELKVEISNRENLTSIKDVQVEGNTARIIIQDEPFFRLTKKDSRTDEPLEGVKFAIYELNVDNSRKDFAKDINGNYIGEQNEEGIYEVVTNEAGIIQLPIRDGKYIAVETEPLEGYIGGLEQTFEIKNGQEQQSSSDDDNEVYVTEYNYEPVLPEEHETTNTIEINTIEDLLDLSYAVAAGNNYSGTKVILMNDLDFTDETSYADSTTTAYGDVNENATAENDGIEPLITELTTEKGFIPIGSEEHPFSGVFDGNDKTISNLRISRPIATGFFGYLKNAEVKNLTINQTATSAALSSGSDVGGITVYATGTTYIKNCSVTGSVGGTGNFFGGIATYAKDNTVIANCNKNGYTGGSNSAGGIVGKATENVKIYNCYNTGDISGGKNLGGIASEIYDNVVIYNCHNTGNVGGANPAGIVTKAKGNIIISNCTNKNTTSNSLHGGIVKTALGNVIIANCTNEASSSYSYLGGIAYEAIGQIKFYNCHNKGTKSGSGAAGIAYYTGGDIQLYNCSNSAESTISGSSCGGLIYGFNYGVSFSGETAEYANIPRKLIIVGCKNEAPVSSGSGLVNWIEVNKETKVRIIDSENKGQISGSSARAGIIGTLSNGQKDLDMILKNVKNEGMVTSNGDTGGIIGQFDVPSSGGNVQFINVVNTGNLPAGGSNRGGMIGYLNYAGTIKFDKCHNSGNVNCAAHSGGLIGYIHNYATVEIKNSYNTGDITGGTDEIGGLIGDNYSNYVTLIENCYNAGNVTAYGTKVGGIIGYSAKVTINDSYNTGNIQGVSQVGGIIGQTWSSPNTISGCYNTGDITGTNATNGAGGIIGHIGTSPTTVTNCYNKGKIEGANIGGISGYDFGGEYKKCINYGKIISNSGYYAGGISSYGGRGYEDCYNYGNISVVNVTYVGGIGAYPQIDSNNQDIKNLYNRGNIFASNGKYVGGVFGYLSGNNDYILENTYNSGKITNIVNSSSTGERTGGIVGMLWGYTLKDAYNEGTISGKNEVAGIVGFASGSTIENVYNIGDLISSTSEKIGPIIANDNRENNSPATVDNAYYLDTAKLGSTDVTYRGAQKNWREMLSTEFYNTLNRDGVWIQKADRPPVLEFKLPVIGTVTEVNLLNDKEEYVIATQVKGEGGTISGQSDIVYETLSFGEDSKKAILAAPLGGYVLTNLSVNGSTIDFTKDLEGNVNLPVGFFRSINEDKLVVASFEEEDKVITVNKVDEVTNEALEGAKFEYSSYPGEWDEYKAAKTTEVQTRIGELTQSTTLGVYPMEETQDGKYVSTNVGINNSLSAAYIPIDLTGLDGLYKVTINAFAPNYWENYGYATIKETTDTPDESDEEGRFMHAGVMDYAQDFSINIEGGKQYYLHLGYKKASYTDSRREDKFTVNSVSIEFSDDGRVDGVFEIGSEKEAEFIYNGDKIYITETQAPEGYSLDKEKHEYTIDDTKLVTITNKAKPVVTAHYYLKENGVYTTKKVATDDTYTGNIGDEYRVDIKSFTDLELEKDEHGEYVIPSNAMGVFPDGGDEVNFYYEAAPIDLTIHHYIEGTETKLAEDEVIETASEVVFDENEDYKYDVIVDEDYVLADNNNYRTLVASSYSLVSVGANVVDNLSIDDTLSYNTNAVLTYTYDNKDFSIKTKVQNHTETVINTETEEEEQILVAGGTISGQDMISYETVIINGNATKDIVVTADEGYIIKSIILTSTPEEGTEATTIIYGEGADENAEITYAGDVHELTLSKFENVQADKLVTVEFERQPANVIVHHIIDDELEDYATVTIEGYVGIPYETEEISIPRYVLDVKSLNTEGTMKEEPIHLYYYYKPDGVPIPTKVVEKYVDINSDEVVDSIDHNGNVGQEYEINPNAPEGYVIIEEDGEGNSLLPTNTTGPMTEEVIEVEFKVARVMSVRAIYVKEGTETKLTDDVVIEGYEGKEYTTSAKTIEEYELVATPLNATGTMRYVDNTEIIVKYEYRKLSPIIDDSTKVVEKYVDINTDDVVEAIDHPGHVGDPYEITPNVPEGYVLVEEDRNGNSLLPTNTEGPMTEEVIEVVFKVAREAKVTVEYIDENGESLEEDIVIPGYEGKYYKAEEKEIEGYRLVEIVGEPEGNMSAGDQVVSYRYEKEEEPVREAYVRVIYIDTDTKEKIAEDTLIEGYEGKPYVTTAKEIDNYEILVVPTNAKGVMAITVDADGEVNNETLVKYIYTKRAPTKVVEKYVDINSEEVVESIDHEGKVGDTYEITPKEVEGYKLIQKDKDGKEILPTNAKGRMTEEVIEVVYYVAKDAKVKAKYVVKYVGKDIVDEVEIEGYEGKEYSVDPKDVNGYELIEIDGKPEGTMKAGENVVTFYYAKKIAGIIPQTGINIYLYTMVAIAMIGGVNAGIVIFYKMRK